MRLILCSCFLIIISLIGFSQTYYSVLAAQYAKEGNYDKAIEFEKKGLELINDSIGNSNFEYANILNNIGGYYYDLDDYANALNYCEQALSVVERIEGKSINYYDILMDISTLYGVNNSFDKAFELDENIYRFLNQNLENIDFNLGYRLMSAASYYFQNGYYLNAISSCEVALKFHKIHLGESHPEFVQTLNELAIYHGYAGNFNEAIKIALNVLQLRENSNGNYSIEYATTLNNLSFYFGRLNNYSEAIKYSEKALKIRQDIFGENNIDYARCLGSLGSLYYHIGEYDKGIEAINKALQIIKLNYGTQYSEYFTFLFNLATIYLDNGYEEDASSCILEMIELWEKYYSNESVEYTNLIMIMAHYAFLSANFEDSLKYYDEYLIISENKLGENNYYSTDIHQRLARCYFYIKDYASLIEQCVQIYSNLINTITKNFFFLPTRERNMFWEKEKHWCEIDAYNYSYFVGDDDININSYNATLLSKGILLNSELEFDKFLVENGDEALLEKYNEIKSLRLQLNKLYEKPIAERYLDTDSLEHRANELERQLMQESAEFGDYTRNLTITWEDVRDNLKDKDAAIEFVSFPLNKDSTMYMAYVLHPNMEAPELVKLFEENDLTSLLDRDDKASIYTNKAASELIWGKLRPQLEGVQNVYFAPDGVLHQIAIEYFPDVDSEGMISDKFNLHRLSSTREIALNRNNAPTKEAVVYGGIKYDTDVATMETESRKYERPKHRGFSQYYNLGDKLALRGSLEYLDGSLTEAVSINGMMKENNYNSTFLSGNDATEESFKNLSGKANGIIHISTHGFYWTESEAERKASLNERLMFMSQLGDNARRNVEDKALTRTGLFMAGAKNALGGVELPEDVDDGILTAQEIANLDLRGLDLVVLSACKTGMGDISGDGVFGLQRGFKKAGANTILMSLWDVSDEATQILMTNFYKNYLGGMSKQNALREAQKTVRETSGFSDPEYWAAFILLDAIN